ncbi:MAG: STAS domain-containing protein [Prevotella sp.]|nr:STAS domain-containing protein [Prevotella sp.]
MTQIIKKDGKTIIKTGKRIDTMNAAEFERDIEPALEQNVDLEIDCSDLIYLASSGLRVMQYIIRSIKTELGGQVKMTHVKPNIYKILFMTCFTRYLQVEQD